MVFCVWPFAKTFQFAVKLFGAMRARIIFKCFQCFVGDLLEFFIQLLYVASCGRNNNQGCILPLQAQFCFDLFEAVGSAGSLVFGKSLFHIPNIFLIFELFDLLPGQFRRVLFYADGILFKHIDKAVSLGIA